MSFNVIHDVDLMGFVGKQESQHLVPLSAVRQEIRDSFSPKAVSNLPALPWAKTHNIFRYRPGEVTLIAGRSSTGKTQFVCQDILWLSLREKVVVASLEMKIEKLGHRMIRQAVGNENPTEEYQDKVINALDGRVWFYAQTGNVEIEKIFGLISYSATVLKATHLFIDSLMMCGLEQETSHAEGAKQSKFISSLCSLAHLYNIHIHIVHHLNKSEKDSTRPTRKEINGSSMIGNKVDNIFLWHRNIEKEFRVEMGEECDEPDTQLIINKQRNGEWTGTVNLWYHQPSMQYIGEDKNTHMIWRGL